MKRSWRTSVELLRRARTVVRNRLPRTTPAPADPLSDSEHYGRLAYEFSQVRVPLAVCRSPDGFYIGTFADGRTPLTRESVEYFSSQELAESALSSGTWTQRRVLS